MPESMDAVFHALSHPARRMILDILRETPGCNVNEVAEHFEMTRIAVMKHLKVLEDADLVISKKEGRDRRLYFNLVPIQMIYDRWTSKYSALWASRLTKIKFDVENETREENGDE